MRKIWMLWVVLLVSKVVVGQNLKDTTYFEGIIIYDVTYVSKIKGITSSQISNLHGNKMMMTFKEGTYRKDFFTQGKSWLRSHYLQVEEKKTYTREVDSDTIFWTNFTENTSKVSITKGKDSVVLNYKIVGYNQKLTIQLKTQKDTLFNVSGSYYFAPDLKVDPNWAADLKEYGYNELLSKVNGMQLLMIEDSDYWTTIYTAVHIIKRKVKDKEVLFKLPENAVLVEL